MTDLHEEFPMREQPDPMIHVRVPAGLRDELERTAARESRTLSGQIRYLLTSAMEARQPVAEAR
jgi:hypothetical protein